MTSQRAQRAAATLLADARVTSLPVPVERLAQHCGAVITYQPFEGDDISGLLLRKDNQPPVIGVNSSNSAVRQRFTIAHELGHLKLHKGELILDRLARVNFRDSTSSQATEMQEIEANAFAACLLMPHNLVAAQLEHHVQRRHLNDEALVEALARDFKVSRPAMEFRLINLGYYTPAG